MLELNNGKKIFEKVERMALERGWSLYQLSKKAGLSTTAFYSWRDRKSLPTLPRLEAVCEVFGITLIDFLLDGDEFVALTEEQKTLLEELGTLSQGQRRALINLVKEFKRND